jgi:hypothetical protein
MMLICFGFLTMLLVDDWLVIYLILNGKEEYSEVEQLKLY